MSTANERTIALVNDRGQFYGLKYLPCNPRGWRELEDLLVTLHMSRNPQQANHDDRPREGG